MRYEWKTYTQSHYVEEVDDTHLFTDSPRAVVEQLEALEKHVRELHELIAAAVPITSRRPGSGMMAEPHVRKGAQQ